MNDLHIHIDTPPQVWNKFAVHDDSNIRGFFGRYRFLSNFWPCIVWYDGLKYGSAEAAYQAAKIVPYQRQIFTFATASDSKKIWKRADLKKICNAKVWDENKEKIMSSIVFDKFLRNETLCQFLCDTEPKYLEETNYWHDNFFGKCLCKKCGGEGLNILGEILMKTRAYFNNNRINISYD